ncbi:MAG: SdpI family protein [Candidatus Neomarinimicrobiota bacterium]
MENEKLKRLKPLRIISLVVIILMFLGAFWVRLLIPAGQPVPVSWNFNGDPARYGNPDIALFIIPLVAVVVSLLFIFIPRIEPRKQHFVQSVKAYSVIWVGLLVVLAVVQVLILVTAAGNQVDVVTVLMVTVGVLFMVMGNYQGKIRSNYLLGVKTPWTLTSELAWNKTHRLAGKLFMLLGAILIAGGILDSGGVIRYGIGFGVPLLIFSIFTYSYFIWKADPNKK